MELGRLFQYNRIWDVCSYGSYILRWIDKQADSKFSLASSLLLVMPSWCFQHFLYELIINILVHNNCFYQLHQFLQYHVLGDSKPLACLMLSLESVYPPAHQLALDMLKVWCCPCGLSVLLLTKWRWTCSRYVSDVVPVDCLSCCSPDHSGHAEGTCLTLSLWTVCTLLVHSPAFFPKPLPIFSCVGCG